MVDNIDVGNSNLTEDEALQAISYLKELTNKEKRLSKCEAYRYLNVSRATFDNYVRAGKLPRGQHTAGFKELSWTKKDLDAFIKECKSKYATQCCCNIQDSITRTNYENQISNLNQTNTLQNSINFVNSSVERGFAATAYATANQTCELKNAIAAQTQVINDKFCALEMREMARENRDLRDKVQAYQLSASQQAQTANIVNQIRPCPTPAYVVPNPYGCGCNNYGYPFNNSCGCGSC